MLFEAYAKVPLVILGCPFLDKPEKLLLSLLINQKNIYRQKSTENEFKISQGRLQIYTGGMQTRSIIQLVDKKLKPTGFVTRFGVDNNDFYVELSDWKNHPWILFTSASMDAMNPTKKVFNKKTESAAWNALNQVKQEEVLQSVTTIEEATHLVNKKLATLAMVTKEKHEPPKVAVSQENSGQWSDRQFVMYFFKKYQEHTGKEHKRISMSTAQNCFYTLRKYYDSDDKIRTHINSFLKAYTGRKGYDPLIFLLGDHENVFQVQFYIDHGVLASEHEQEKPKSRAVSF
ncbi:hypothetical protein [Paenibacillus sp. L3-i20]|uniref:hypothetical protein n=1 Tax=Paenibacillus sp. L3-i20 TaxID=2905833 RepID=UPI001EDE1A80|nr:hypothetical protein [Paenibacillus sp. L3-i20]GKU80507.1 hypothetical protein L3i20_v249040 [Paenibacillus sp. L3-i20]